MAAMQKYTFDTFIVGASNKAAYNAAVLVASNMSDSYNTVFIYGGAGLGKSHLLKAIGLTLSNNSNINVCYCSAENFMYEVFMHLRSNQLDLLRKRFRSVDVLLLDDIQFMSGKVGHREEYFQIFGDLYEAQKQIVITSDRPLNKTADIDEQLHSHFEWGLLAAIKPPGLKTRINFLEKESAILELQIPAEVLHYLADTCTQSIRELEGVLIRLRAYSSMENMPITLEMTKKNIRHIIGPPENLLL